MKADDSGINREIVCCAEQHLPLDLSTISQRPRGIEEFPVWLQLVGQGLLEHLSGQGSLHLMDYHPVAIDDPRGRQRNKWKFEMRFSGGIEPQQV